MITMTDGTFNLLVVAIVIVVCGIAWLAYVIGRDVERDKWEERRHRQRLAWSEINFINADLRKGLRDAEEDENCEGDS